MELEFAAGTEDGGSHLLNFGALISYVDTRRLFLTAELAN